MKLTSKERTHACRSYARRHGFSVRAVRAMTVLRREAIWEYVIRRGSVPGKRR